MLLSVFLSIIIAAAAVVYLYDPSKNGFYPECLFYSLTGLYCPGCGSTRAVHQLLHGNIAAAFKLNSLVVSLLPFLVFGAIAEVGVVAVQRHGQRRGVYRFVWLIPVAIVLFGILRNIPLEPFTYLRPR
ncbi:MAG: DUF2752 domain-containing protein [Nitrospirae bacterium]|nr:DUF2752 domain-containing protein [Nitrospirota bacterium]